MFASNTSAANGGATYIEDVFSTWLYTGNGSTQTITNGIDLSTKGGLVWIKQRNGVNKNVVNDTQRGATKEISTNETAAEITAATGLTSFNTNGFSLGSRNAYNGSALTFASWTFRKQPKFFDVVTYTGNGSTQNIAHSLGSVPGCIIVKRTSTSSNWLVHHIGVTSTSNELWLNSTAAAGSAGMYNSITATSDTTFTVSNVAASADANANFNGQTYVAYLFAHNAGGFGLTGTDNVISCGSYTGNDSINNITLGWEPQWVLVKCSTQSDATFSRWTILDNMRGIPATGSSSAASLWPNSSDAESTGYNGLRPTATGFQLVNGNQPENLSPQTYIYIAIRRGPMKVPTSGTSVYSVQTYNGNATAGTLTTGFPVDVAIAGSRASASVSSFPGSFTSRLTGANKYIVSSSTAAEVSNPGVGDYAVQNGIGLAGGNNTFNWTSTPYVLWAMQRAPSFMDAVCHTGTGANLTLAHNLTVAPELVITKKRSAINEWYVSHTFTGTGYKRQYLEQTAAATDHLYSANFIYTAKPTASSLFFTDNSNVNQSGQTFVNYLFASLPGVSKVGSYTGTGATQVINCGFTGGARFVLIKATSTTGNWMVWDTARGIITSVDPYLMFNSKVDEITSTDWVDPAASGFELSNAAGNLANSNGVSYIFLAIA